MLDLIKWTTAAMLVVLICTAPIGAFCEVSVMPVAHHAARIADVSGSVYSIMQDRDGFLWFGTTDGLVRYDGYSLLKFRHDAEDSLSISDDTVTALYQARNGVIWVGTDKGGLNRFDRDTGEFTRYMHDPADVRSINHNSIRGIVEDVDGHLWVATNGGGMNHFNPSGSTFTQFMTLPIEANNIWEMAEDGRGNLWLATSNGLYRFDRGTQEFQHFPHWLQDEERDSWVSSRIVTVVDVSNSGEILAGLFNDGLYVLNPGEKSFAPVGNDALCEFLTSTYIRSMTRDAKGALWLGTRDDGLVRVPPDRKKFERFSHVSWDDNTISNDGVTSLYIDHVGNIWAGTFSGVNNISWLAGQFNHYVIGDLGQGPGAVDVLDMDSDESGTLWLVNRRSGVHSFNPRSGQTGNFSNGLLGVEQVLSIDVEKSGGLLIGTRENGLRRFVSGGDASERVNTDVTLGNGVANIREVFTDSHGLIWFGGDGLGMYDPQTRRTVLFEPHQQDGNALSSLFVTAIEEDDHDNVWIGTSAGLNRYERETGGIVQYRYRQSSDRGLTGDRINDIHRDSSGVLWVGTDKGLNRYDRQRDAFEYIPELGISGGRNIVSIIDDSGGGLWLGTLNGFVSYSPAQKQYRYYSHRDGLRIESFNRGAAESLNGTMLVFGGLDGFVSFVPDSLEQVSAPSPVVITSVRILNSARSPIDFIDSNSVLNLDYNESSLLVSFATLDYTAPERNRYSYMIEGFDLDWIYAGERNTVMYPNLPPGSYVLRVRGTDSHGVWSPRRASLAIVIAPPFWQTRMFRGIAALFLIAVIIGVPLFRIYTVSREKKRLERLVRERTRMLAAQEVLYRNMVETSPDAILLLSMNGDIIKSNMQAVRICGGNKLEDVTGKNIQDFLVESERQLYRETTETLFNKRILKEYEYKARRLDGEEIIVEVNAAVFRDIESKKHLIVTDIRDITDRKELELEFLQSQKMESVGRLAGGIAHDFNNLLTIILGNVDTMLTISKSLTEVERRSLGDIENAANRAADLTQRILAFSRRQIIEQKIVDLNTILQGIDRMLQHLIGEDIKLITIMTPGIWHVKADRGQIEQILVNLAVNARDAMPDGGTLTIETLNVVVDDSFTDRHGEMAMGEYVMVAVSDTGHGMNEDIVAKIFDPFFTTKHEGKGTGLGLSTCYGIVKQNNGYIWVYSEPGVGTTFKIHLPRSVELPRELVPEHAPIDTNGTETILVVEDEPILRKMTERILIRSGYTVLLAENGRDALNLIEENKDDNISLIITDVVMPVLGGKDLADAAKTLLPDARVLFVSGYTENAIVKNGVLLDDINFLPKPFTPKDIRRKVREILDA